MSSRLRTRDDSIRRGDSTRAAVGGASRTATDVRAWRVLHAADLTAPLSALVSGQLELGMRPEVLSRQGPICDGELPQSVKRKPAATAASLLQLWRQARVWDRLIRSALYVSDYEIIHAHGLASTLAAVRSEAPVVYEVNRFAGALGLADTAHTHPLRNRALRSVEQFALHRAVVVCHEPSSGDELISRGVDPEDLFVIPEAMLLSAPAQPRTEWLRRRGLKPGRDVVLYAPAWQLEVDARGELTANSRTLLEVFTVISAEAEEARFVAEFERKARAAIDEWSAALGIKPLLRLVGAEERRAAEVSADIILAGDVPHGEMSALNPFAVRALQNRKALLAADVTCNRDLTPDGRGCIWYAHESPRDLARRAAFLAKNPDFRRSIATAGYNYLRDSRDSVGVAARYDAVYRRARLRSANGRVAPPMAGLAPVQTVA